MVSISPRLCLKFVSLYTKQTLKARTETINHELDLYLGFWLIKAGFYTLKDNFVTFV